MPYISSEDVKKKRDAVEKAFPKWKFSITKHHYSGICVNILEGNIPARREKYEQVNEYYIKDHYKDNPLWMDALLKIKDIINGGNYTQSVDGDYGNIPSFYIYIQIGQWDKPYIYKS